MKKIFTKKKIFNFLLLNFALILVAFTVCFFLKQNNLVSGGISGLGILIELVFNIDASLIILAINVCLLLVALKLMGKSYFLKTAYGSLMYPVYMMIIDFVFSKTSIQFVHDPFLVVIFSSLMMGAGLGLAMRCGGTTGGTDILLSIFLKFFHIPMSKAMYVIDGTIIFFGMLNNGLESGLCAIIFLVICGQVIDGVVFGSFNNRAVYIVSEHHESIIEYINERLLRGATIIDGKGSYTQNDKKVILSILTSQEYFLLRAHIDSIDNDAFMFVTKASEVKGLGFSIKDPDRAIRKKKIKKRDLIK